MLSIWGSVRLSTVSPGGWCTCSLSAPERIASGKDGKDSFTGGVKDKLSLATNCCQTVSLFTKSLFIFVILCSAVHENLLWANFWKSEKSCSNQNLELTDNYLYCKCLYLTAALLTISISLRAISFSISFAWRAKATFVTFSSQVVTPSMVCAMFTNSFADMQTWCRLSGRFGWNLAVCTKHRIFAVNKATATPRQSTGRRGMFLQKNWAVLSSLLVLGNLSSATQSFTLDFKPH